MQQAWRWHLVKIRRLNPLTAKARVQFADDDITSFWLPVLQQKTNKDKFYSMVDVGEQVACLMDQNSEDGVIFGAIYTGVDSVLGISKDQHIIKFEDGSFIEYNKETQMLTIVADILNTGKIQNTDGITSAADITDKKSSMQAMRDVYNPHARTGNMGSPTSAPDGAM